MGACEISVRAGIWKASPAIVRHRGELMGMVALSMRLDLTLLKRVKRSALCGFAKRGFVNGGRTRISGNPPLPVAVFYTIGGLQQAPDGAA